MNEEVTHKNRMSCKPKLNASQKELYIVYNTRYVPVDIYQLQDKIEDVGGIFIEESDANDVANCLNKISFDRYKVVPIKINQQITSNFRDMEPEQIPSSMKHMYMYVVYLDFLLMHVYNITKQTTKKYYTEKVCGIATSYEQAKKIASELNVSTVRTHNKNFL